MVCCFLIPLFVLTLCQFLTRSSQSPLEVVKILPRIRSATNQLVANEALTTSHCAQHSLSLAASSFQLQEHTDSRKVTTVIMSFPSPKKLLFKVYKGI